MYTYRSFYLALFVTLLTASGCGPKAQRKQGGSTRLTKPTQGKQEQHTPAVRQGASHEEKEDEVSPPSPYMAVDAPHNPEKLEEKEDGPDEPKEDVEGYTPVSTLAQHVPQPGFSVLICCENVNCPRYNELVWKHLGFEYGTDLWGEPASYFALGVLTYCDLCGGAVRIRELGFYKCQYLTSAYNHRKEHIMGDLTITSEWQTLPFRGSFSSFNIKVWPLDD